MVVVFNVSSTYNFFLDHVFPGDLNAGHGQGQTSPAHRQSRNCLAPILSLKHKKSAEKRSHSSVEARDEVVLFTRKPLYSNGLAQLTPSLNISSPSAACSHGFCRLGRESQALDTRRISRMLTRKTPFPHDSYKGG